MTRLDLFAAQAMAALLEKESIVVEGDDSSGRLLAWRAYQIAKAMEKEANVQGVLNGDD